VKIQLWSYNYAPEPTGIGPLSTVLGREMARRGHSVRVVAAHPHYPEPRWGLRLRPYREVRDGVQISRLPLWPGRGSTFARLRQEISFTTSLSLAAPFLGKPDVMVAVSPSFPALAAAMSAARARRIPWILWVQDILPDGAAATGILPEGKLLRAARRFERRAYRSASRIVVISDSFRENLLAKGVPAEKLVRIYNPATEALIAKPRPAAQVDPGLVLTMGNIGHTQNLVEVVRAFQRSKRLAERGAKFVVVGDGVAANDVRAAIRTDRVEVTGLVPRTRLQELLSRAAVAVVSQRYEGLDFNVPSKLMNFMGQGIPTVAAVRPDSEVARLIDSSGGGWAAETSDLDSWADNLADALDDRDERERRGEAAWRFAQRNFAPTRFADQFEELLQRSAN
jgi:colanic acid biosynthesis glycosyl transferase WcaI